MKIYTSYFSNIRKLTKDRIVPIGIALYPPKWYEGESLKYVAPTYSIFNFAKSREEYTRRYNIEVLGRLSPQKVVFDIERLSKGKDVALCCFEKPGEFCHRHILAEWLNKAGYKVEEYEGQKVPKELSLF